MISVLGLSACSAVSKIKGVLTDASDLDYSNNQSVKQLEVPPDLTTPEFDKAFELPTGVISAVSLKNGGSGSLQGSSRSTNSNVGAIRTGDLSSIRTIGGRSVLQINDTYPRSLVLTEIMLTRMGFSTISKSSNGGAITVKYNGATVNVAGKRGGFFSKAKNLVGLGRDNNKALINGESYRVTIRNEQGSPIVRFARVNAKSISNAANTKIITLLNSAFNR